MGDFHTFLSDEIQSIFGFNELSTDHHACSQPAPTGSAPFKLDRLACSQKASMSYHETRSFGLFIKSKHVFFMCRNIRIPSSAGSDADGEPVLASSSLCKYSFLRHSLTTTRGDFPCFLLKWPVWVNECLLPRSFRISDE
jgi:hypothetical protein